MQNPAEPVSKIALGTDHAGFAAKEVIKEWLEGAGYVVEDCGAYTFDPDDDYPGFIAKAAQVVQADNAAVGIIFGGSGQGEAMQANRFKGVRAVAYYGGQDDIVTLSREHNGANVLSFGARFLSLEEMKRAITMWLLTPRFADPKYERRAKQMDTYEQT